MSYDNNSIMHNEKEKNMTNCLSNYGVNCIVKIFKTIPADKSKIQNEIFTHF